MIHFMIPHIQNMAENGWDVEIACSPVGNRMDEIHSCLDGIAKIHTVRLHRSPVDPDNLNGYRDMKQLINGSQWDVIWTNEPVMGVVTRLAARKARKTGTKVVYMVHGFHFYDGAPLINWLVFYPIEWLMSFYADMIITLNQADYKRAKKLHAKDVKYIHGIGVNTARLDAEPDIDIRKELGIPADACLLLSIGELNENKNHRVIVDAMAGLNDKDIYYAICGIGDTREELLKQAKEKGLEDHLFLLGYRKDLANIFAQTDIYVFPSIREGLPIAPLEAMYSGLPLVVSDTGGLKDYMQEGRNGFLCPSNDSAAFANAIKQLKENPEKRKTFGAKSKEIAGAYCIGSVKKEVCDIFTDLYRKK